MTSCHTILLLFFSLYTSRVYGLACPDECVCTPLVWDCVGGFLRQLPSTNASVMHLDMRHNMILYITDTDMTRVQGVGFVDVTEQRGGGCVFDLRTRPTDTRIDGLCQVGIFYFIKRL